MSIDLSVVNFLLNVSCFLIELDPLTSSLFYEPLHLKSVYNNLTNGTLEVKILHNGARLLVGSGRFNWQDKDSYLVSVTFKSKTRRMPNLNRPGTARRHSANVSISITLHDLLLLNPH